MGLLKRSPLYEVRSSRVTIQSPTPSNVQRSRVPCRSHHYLEPPGGPPKDTRGPRLPVPLSPPDTIRLFLVRLPPRPIRLPSREAPGSPVVPGSGCSCFVGCRSSSQTQSAALPRPPRRQPSLHPGTDSSRPDAGTMVMAEGTAVLRRNRPGTKAQYIQQNIRADCSNIDKILEPPEGQDEGVWKYEHLRQFCLELNGLAVKLQSECHPDTCTQMTATEQWIFLCAAHKTPKECPAIDYTRHTLDGAACLLNSNKYFPSRVSIKESSVAKLGSVCRRIYRIFSHAYFHHRQIFDEYENETFLCHRFTKFVMKYNLMSKDNLIVPILEEEVQNSVSGESEA
ncbi:MOB-like protein phocein isoform X2 [Cebus imitator]|uniref:MOB-like protein phocein isoform X2 n=1 Tax=Cebus imitator TaxID=2715852 RepID=UPI00189B9596|nr:MOB-like protein phocein isoform X2 [Cebus imitator]